jgi:rhomboid protease GluP
VTTLISIFLRTFEQPEKNPRPYTRQLFSITAFIIVVVIGVFVFLNTGRNSFDQIKYNRGITEFTENENIALRIYSLIEDEQTGNLPILIEETGIANWKRNIEIIDRLNDMENLPEELRYQNLILLDYCSLRLAAYELISRAVEEESSHYDNRIKLTHQQIEELMDEMEDQAVVMGKE